MTPLQAACNVLNAVELTSGKNAKVSLLKEHAENPFLQFIVRNALDWFVMFGITKEPKDYVTPMCRPDPSMADLEQAVATKKGADLYALFDSYNSDNVRKWLVRMILKDLRCGIAEGTVEKVWGKGFIRTFEVALAEVYRKGETKISFPIIAEDKIDGLRCVVTCKRDGTIIFNSREGQKLIASPEIEAHLRRIWDISNPEMVDFVLDCELFCESLNKTMSLCRRDAYDSKFEDQRSQLVLYAFDCMALEDFQTQQPRSNYIARNAMLDMGVIGPLSLGSSSKPDPVQMPSGWTICHDHREIDDAMASALDRGLEGIMLKDPQAPYKFGRSSAMLKYKPVEEMDVVITGTYEGTGKNAARLGGFYVRLPSGVEQKVGGGNITDVERGSFWADRESMVGKTIEVEYKMLTPDGLLREPIFKRFRPDKD